MNGLSQAAAEPLSSQTTKKPAGRAEKEGLRASSFFHGTTRRERSRQSHHNGSRRLEKWLARRLIQGSF
jgi:hypothetical protein